MDSNIKSKKSLLRVGRIATTHGLKGEIKVDVWCDSPDQLLSLESFCIKEKEFIVDKIKEYKNSLLITFVGVNTIEEAQNLVGKILCIERSKFPLKNGSYFVDDLIGLRVYDYNDKQRFYGIIKNVLQPGANDVYVLEDDDKKERLIPAIKNVIKSIDIDGCKMEIEPLRGLFDEN